MILLLEIKIPKDLILSICPLTFQVASFPIHYRLCHSALLGNILIETTPFQPLLSVLLVHILLSQSWKQ